MPLLPIIPCFIKMQNGLPFSCCLVILEKRLLNRCSSSISSSSCWYRYCAWQLLSMNWPWGQKVKGQCHAVNSCAASSGIYSYFIFLSMCSFTIYGIMEWRVDIWNWIWIHFIMHQIFIFVFLWYEFCYSEKVISVCFILMQLYISVFSFLLLFISNLCWRLLQGIQLVVMISGVAFCCVNEFWKLIYICPIYDQTSSVFLRHGILLYICRYTDWSALWLQ